MDAEEIEVEEDMEVDEEWEEDPEEEEEVSEEVEEDEEDVGGSSNSPNISSKFQKDVERDSETKRPDRHLVSCSSRIEEFKSCPELNPDAGGLKSTSPSDGQSITLNGKSLSLKNLGKELSLTEDEGTQESCINNKLLRNVIEEAESSSPSFLPSTEQPTGNSQPNNLSLRTYNEPRQENIELVSLGKTEIGNTAGKQISDSVPGSAGMGQKTDGACISGNNIKWENEKRGTQSRNMGVINIVGEKVSDSVSGRAGMCQKSDGACSSGNSRGNVKLENEKIETKSRPRSFSPGGEMKEPQQKRAGLVCEFFAKGWCIRGKSCRFLHVKDNSNNTTQQHAGNNIAGSSEIRPDEERITSGDGVRGKSCLLRESSGASLHNREEIYLVNSQTSPRVASSTEDIGFISSSKDIRRERLKQNCGAEGFENRSLGFSNGNPSIGRSGFVPEHRSSFSSYRKFDMAPSEPAWTGSISHGSFNMNAYASGAQRQFENGNKFYGSGSLSALQGFSAASCRDPEGNNTGSKQKKVSSNDWEPSEPFRPSFVIPPSILPSCGTLYDPFRDGMDIQKLEDDLNASFSSKGEHKQKPSYRHKDGDSASGPQTKECNNDKNSSCSQNQYQEAAPETNSEVHRVEMVATSVVEQNETTPKNGTSSAPAQNKDVLKRSRPNGGCDSWHRSDMCSHIEISRADRAKLGDEVDGEVRSDAGMKVMRHFRAALIDTIKELLKPIWREGRLSKDVHNMIVKKAAEKVISTAVQFHQLPTDTESVEQYLSISQTKIVKLVEGYVEKFRKS